VSFRDNGPGIPLSDQEHVFERFYRVGGDRARQSGGTGLGLSIVKRIVLAHGGRVSLQSTPGHGATFTVWLPVTA
jgi:signal transduction histidine kinase